MIFLDELPGYAIDPSVFSAARAIQIPAAIPLLFEPVPLKSPDGEWALFPVGALAARFLSPLASRVLDVIGFRL